MTTTLALSTPHLPFTAFILFLEYIATEYNHNNQKFLLWNSSFTMNSSISAAHYKTEQDRDYLFREISMVFLN